MMTKSLKKSVKYLQCPAPKRTEVLPATGHGEDAVTWVRGLTIGRLSQNVMGR